MPEPILLLITYHGDTLDLPLELVPWGHTYQLHVQLADRRLIFERDENLEYRMIDHSRHAKPVDRELVLTIISSLNALHGLE